MLGFRNSRGICSLEKAKDKEAGRFSMVAFMGGLSIEWLCIPQAQYGGVWGSLSRVTGLSSEAEV